MSRSETRCTSDSLRLRYSIRSAMVPIFSLCSAANCKQIRQPRHGAVVAHDLAQHRGGREAGEARQVAARFGVAGAHQHAAGMRDQRKDMAGLHDVLGLRVFRSRPL